MFTRCPQCKIVHPLSAKLISHSNGQVRCAQCGGVFSALSFLFDEWPAGRAYGPSKDSNSAPPIIGTVKKTEGDTQNQTTDDDADSDLRTTNRLAWGLAAALLALLTILNAGWTFRDPLLENPRINSWVEQAGWLQVEQDGLLKDPQQIQLISRDIHTHPTRSGILVLSLTFVNLAQRTQVFPVLKVTLLDAANQPVAQRQLQPKDYLRADADIDMGLAADVFLPVLLELADPGNQAVGFEIDFL